MLFADIRNFTSLAETLSPRATVEVLNEIYTELFEAVAARNGVLDKFLGDAIMAHWGAPIATDRDPLNAVEGRGPDAATGRRLNAADASQGAWPHLRLGMGIATGEGGRRRHRLAQAHGLHGDRRQREPGRPARRP